MNTNLIAALGLASAALLPAHAALVNDASQIALPSVVADFEGFDGLLSTGPVLVAPGVTFTGDAGSELGANNRDLGENGLWGGFGNHFAAGANVGELRFTFGQLSSGAGAFVNHYALSALPLGLVISVYGDNNQIIETHTVTVATDINGYDQGVFLGITRADADIRSISFKGLGVVVDNVTVTTAVPEPQTYALLLAGLALVGAAAKRRRQPQA